MPKPLIFSKEIPVLLVLRRTLSWNKHEQPSLSIIDWLPFPKKLRLPFQLKEGKIELGSEVELPVFNRPPSLLLVSLDLNTHGCELQGLQATKTYDLLPLSLSQKSEKIEISFRWEYFTVGDPERNGMKIGEIASGKSLEFRINGKRDFSLSGRRDRSYHEQSIWIQHLGKISEIEEFRNKDFPTLLPEADKLVDLRKLLW